MAGSNGGGPLSRRDLFEAAGNYAREDAPSFATAQLKTLRRRRLLLAQASHPPAFALLQASASLRTFRSAPSVGGPP